jgi:uncharacterized protein (DUF58 family)
VLDLDQAVQVGEGQESTEEYGIILAASLADRTLRQNRAVGLVAHGSEFVFVPLGRGRGQLWHILRSLAAVRAGGTRRLADVLSSIEQNLGQNTTVLVITPSCEPDWPDALLPLTRRGIVPTVVLLDPASFTIETGAPRGRAHDLRAQIIRAETMRHRLIEAGMTTHLVPQGYPFRYVTQPERRGHWEFKVTPMGRAIVVQRPD